MKRNFNYVLISVFACLLFSGCGANSKKFESEQFVRIPMKNYKMLKTEVTQKLYTEVMDSFVSEYLNSTANRAKVIGNDYPAQCVWWNEAVIFCNLLSERMKKTPVYTLNGETDVRKWKIAGYHLFGELMQNSKADGYRLPTVFEWTYSARGNEPYIYSGCDYINEVGYLKENSDRVPHPVAQKNPNAFGLYDMTGNVEEWCWDEKGDEYVYKDDGVFVDDPNVDLRPVMGGHYDIGHDKDYGLLSFRTNNAIFNQDNYSGFRIICLDTDPDVNERIASDIKKFKDGLEADFVEIPGENFKINKYETTQLLYETVMGTNPSYFIGRADLPVERVTWFDSLVFCNRLSSLVGKTPAYALNGETDTSKWDWAPQKVLSGDITVNMEADGYRLPTCSEWLKSEKGCWGDGNLSRVSWYNGNSDRRSHEVGRAEPSEYGLYDLVGNVTEWLSDITQINGKYAPLQIGGGWGVDPNVVLGEHFPFSRESNFWSFSQGFRIMCLK